jgi:chromate reductase, NAD(P)H dehydrogenase (quinone)
VQRGAAMSYRIAVLVGSLRKDSFNRKLADGLAKLASAELTLEQVAIGELPLYDQDHELSPPEPVTRFKSKIAAADGLLFVTPEYNRSIPGVLKNAIDHGSRPYGQSCWKGKPAGIVGASIGTLGTAMAQQHLRNVLAYLDVPTLGQPEAFIQATDDLFDASGNIASPRRELLQSWMERYEPWVKRFAPSRG